MLNLQELAIFVTAAEHGSFSEAGRQLHLSQPAISQSVQTLERRLNAPLFLRVGRSVKLTEYGETLLPLARDLLANAARIEEAIAAMHGPVIGRIEIGCSTTSGKYLLPGLIARFRALFPQVHLDVIIGSRESVTSKLIDGAVNLSVTSRAPEQTSLEAMPFFSDEVILIARWDHPWARFGKIYVDDLLDVPIILRESSSGTAEVVTQALRGRGITPDMLNVVMVLGNAEAIEVSVEEGIGVAFVSRLAAQRGLELGRIAEINVEGLSLRRDLYLLRNVRLPLSRAQSAFWEFVQKSIPALAARAAPQRSDALTSAG